MASPVAPSQCYPKSSNCQQKLTPKLTEIGPSNIQMEALMPMMIGEMTQIGNDIFL